VRRRGRTAGRMLSATLEASAETTKPRLCVCQQCLLQVAVLHFLITCQPRFTDTDELTYKEEPRPWPASVLAPFAHMVCPKIRINTGCPAETGLSASPTTSWVRIPGND
jgi:hypothetical protein